MSDMEKSCLSKEAGMQLKALKKIGRWKNIAIALSTLGIGIFYAGAAGTDPNWFLCALSVLLILISAGCAVVLNLGLKNGKRNVEKMVNLLEKENNGNMCHEL